MSKHSVAIVYEVMRDNVVFGTARATSPGEITMEASAAIKRSLSCELMLPEGANMLTDELRISVITEGKATLGKITLPFTLGSSGKTKKSLGYFIATTMPKTVGADGKARYGIEAYDRTYKVYSKKLESRAEGFIAAGTLYTTVIKQLLTSCGIRNMLIEDSNLSIASDREDWDVGTSYLDIVNTLLGEINYATLWFDSDGVARSEAYVSPVAKEPTIRYLSGHDSIVMRAHKVEDDTFSAYNVFIVGCNKLVDNNAVYVTSVNDDPSSKLSTVQRGRIVAPVEMLQDVASTQVAQEYADNLKLKSMISTETAQIQTGFNPGHELLDVIEVSIPELTGKFEEIAWTLPLTVSDLMTHKIRRAVYV